MDWKRIIIGALCFVLGLWLIPFTLMKTFLGTILFFVGIIELGTGFFYKELKG